jgi:hypothetical protein
MAIGMGWKRVGRHPKTAWRSPINKVHAGRVDTGGPARLHGGPASAGRGSAPRDHNLQAPFLNAGGNQRVRGLARRGAGRGNGGTVPPGAGGAPPRARTADRGVAARWSSSAVRGGADRAGRFLLVEILARVRVILYRLVSVGGGAGGRRASCRPRQRGACAKPRSSQQGV